MLALSQIAAVTMMNLRAIPQRAGASAVIVIGMACVVGVTLSVLSLSEGFMTAIRDVVPKDAVVVMSQGARFPQASFISRDNALTIIDAPGISKTAEGKPRAYGDFYAGVPMTKRGDGFTTFVSLIGQTQAAIASNPDMKIVEGRSFQPGLHELLVGRAAQQQFVGLDVGTTIPLPQGDWSIVGTYTSINALAESALIGDAETLMSAFQRPVFATVQVRVEGAQGFDRLSAEIAANPTLTVNVRWLRDIAAEQAEQLNSLLRFVGLTLGIIMGAGAVFGALNTMYSAVSTRQREIATLRAIGFGPAPVVISVLVESLALALIGAFVGAAIAWLAFNGNVHTVGGALFELRVNRALITLGIGMATMVGFLGGLLPAVRAARAPVIDALRTR